MKSSCLASVVELVRRIPSAIQKPDWLSSCVVIVRALASLLQYVGLIKAEFVTTDVEFESKFYEQLKRYSVLYAKSKIVTTVRNPTGGLWIGDVIFTDFASVRPH